MKMIKISNIPDSLIEQVKDRAAKLGHLKNSNNKGKTNDLGYLGQMIVAKVFKWKEVDTYDYDLTDGTYTYEVKTKGCNVPPDSTFDCCVYESNINQKCDYYVFVRATNDLRTVWILGKKPASDFRNQAIRRKKGELDPKAKDDYRYPADCRILEISQLEKI
jgi:hypothetical protein